VVHNDILLFRLKDLWSNEINKTIQGYAELVTKGSQKHEVLRSFADDMSVLYIQADVGKYNLLQTILSQFSK